MNNADKARFAALAFIAIAGTLTALTLAHDLVTDRAEQGTPDESLPSPNGTLVKVPVNSDNAVWEKDIGCSAERELYHFFIDKENSTHIWICKPNVGEDGPVPSDTVGLFVKDDINYEDWKSGEPDIILR